MSKIRLAFVPRPRRGETENMYTLLQTKYTLKRFCLYYYSFRRREPSFVDLFFFCLETLFNCRSCTETENMSRAGIVSFSFAFCCFEVEI